MAEADQPSYRTSTTSLLVVIAVLAYVLSCLFLVGLGAWRQDATLLTGGSGGLESLVVTLFTLYGIRKGVEMGKNGTK